MHSREQINLRLSRVGYQEHQSILTGLVNNVVKATVYCCQ